MAEKLKGKTQNGVTYDYYDIDAAKSAEINKNNVLVFRNGNGSVVFTVDLSDITATFGDIVPSVNQMTIIEGETGHLGVKLAVQPTKNQTVRLVVDDDSGMELSTYELEFTPENWDVEQDVTINAPQDDNSKNETTSLILKSKRVNDERIDIIFKDNDVWGDGKQIISDISPMSRNKTDSVTLYHDAATGEDTTENTTPWRYINPFRVKSDGAYNKACDRLMSNVSGAYSFISIGGTIQYNFSLWIGNYYGTKGWDSVACGAKSVPYINTNGESVTWDGIEAESDVRWSELPWKAKNWKRAIYTIVLNATGTIDFYGGDMLLYSAAAPEDFAKWVGEANKSVWGQKSYRTGWGDTYDTAQFGRTIIVNDAVTPEEISNYYDSWVAANDAIELRADGLALTPGDSFKLRPKFYTASYSVPTYESANTGLATVSDGGVVTAITSGTTKITAYAFVGGQSVESTSDVSIVDSLPYDLTSSRVATDITLARITDTIEVGEEFSAQAYVLSAVTEEHPCPYRYYDDNLVKFTSSDPSVCSVRNGVLKGIAPGTATITVTDLAETVSKTFSVTVTAATSLQYTDEEVLILQESDVDSADSEATTLSIQSLLSDAHENGYKKVVFPENQTYYVSPMYGTIYIPTQMIVDFNGAVIQVETSDMTQTGYLMFSMKNCIQSEIQNATIYGDRFISGTTGKESCRSVGLSGTCYRAGLRNCTISRSPGFNLGFGWTNLARKSFALASIEEGGIDDNGQDVSRDYSYRCNNYIDLNGLGDKFGLGNMQGYGGYRYMSARVYDIFFYDSDKTFLSSLKNCVQYYRYDMPSNAAYARICYYWGEAPTSSDPDFHAIAHLYSFDIPTQCFVKNCTFEDNYSTAITPNGADGLLIDGCTFRNNGYRDPASHIDWEDGRQNNKGHILRNCTFTGGGNVTLVGADGTAIHDNTFENCALTNGDEVQNSRVWLNQFIGNKASNITSKTDMVFAQNFGFDGASCTRKVVDGVDFAIREYGNVF